MESRRFVTAIPLLCCLCFLAACVTEEGLDDAPEAAVEEAGMASDNVDAACPSLVGSWELVSISEDAPALEEDFELDPDYQEAPTLKIINDTHWMFLRQNAEKLVHGQGGRYTLQNGMYTEIVEYSAVPQNIGKEYVFECRLEGDSLWHHVGGLGDYRYDELWRKVK